jgi:hypothetical protein
MIELIGEDQFNNKIFYSNIKDDEFVHFTTPERAEQILKNGKLLIDAPYEQFGPYAVYAVSTLYGKFHPKVQTTHIKSEDIVAILFKTNTIPKVGFIEETSWNKDVDLLSPRIISKDKAISILNKSAKALGDDFDSDYVLYDRKQAEKEIHHKTANKIARVLYIAKSLQLESKTASRLVSIFDIVDEETLNDPQEYIYDLIDPEEEKQYRYEVKTISPEKAVTQFKTVAEDMTVLEAFEDHAIEDQINIVKDKMKHFDSERVIVTSNNKVIDGNHHLVAAIKSNKPINYVNLQKPIEN